MVAASDRHRLIVDSQVHIWRARTPDRPWPLGGAARAHLPEPFSYDKLVALMNEAGVDRAILVPPSWEGNWNDHALEAAGKFPDRFAVMGRIRVDDPASADLLPKWKDEPIDGLHVSALTSRQLTGRDLSQSTVDGSARRDVVAAVFPKRRALAAATPHSPIGRLLPESERAGYICPPN